ncbi:DUF2239 family protein [Pseudomaricurvus alkylphenolicus]|uniref:DUF2239 family protein n=1 Tax=Pseudomaricurvus alkylphenolicus TaxID=1306991 RepID=UPI0014216A5B|nr:DUF2239 family protein [Pseudomaricurvus alkylphenolicus]NIB38612.1 DUF2239 family protein [Pseudomaricurvus alkylphenolicus]
MSTRYLAIHERKILAKGTLEEVVHKVKAIDPDVEPTVVKEENCRELVIGWRGDAEAVLSNLPPEHNIAPKPATKRGRPKLGVVAKEVTLLPEHWEWLASQRGGASMALRRLVDKARENTPVEDLIVMKQQELDSFMMRVLGDAPGFEEATRSLYRNSSISFTKAVEDWPGDLKEFVLDKFFEIADLHSGKTSK